MKKLLTISLAIVLIMAFCFNFGSSIPKTRAQDGDNSRDVIPPTTYITGDQAHARLFRYNGTTTFTNISATNQNISPEVNAIAWNGTYWAMAARGRLWRYNGAAVTEVLTPDPSPTPADNIYPYAAIGSNGAGGKWLAGTLTGRGMYYNGTDIPSAYNLAISTLSAGVDDITTTLPVADASPFNIDDIVQVGFSEFCLVTDVDEINDELTVTRGYYGSGGQQHWPDDEVKIAFSDIVSVDWDNDHGRWILAGLIPDFSTHLFATPATDSSTDLGLTDVSQAKGDYRTNDYTYYLVGGQTNNGDTSKLYAMDNATDLFTIDLSPTIIPNMDKNVTVITGGGSNWLVGGEGTNTPGNILYDVSEAGNVFTGTPITTPPDLTAITAIGYNDDGNNWLIAGTNSGGKAKLYSYDNGFTALVDLTSQMQSETQAAITIINSIVWNGTYWLIGGAGEFNVSPDVGGSVMSTDESAKVAFTGSTVEHDSSVSVSKTTGAASDASLESASSVYDFTCQDLVSDNLVTQFDKSATINLTYDPTELGDTPEGNLSIYYYDEATGEWIPVSGGTIDTAHNTITAEVDHFTKFGVFASSLPYTGK